MPRIRAKRDLDDLCAGRSKLPSDPDAAIERLYQVVIQATGDESEALDAVQSLAWKFAKQDTGA